MKKLTILAGMTLCTCALMIGQAANAEDTYTNKTTTGNVTIVGGTDELKPTPPTPYPPTGPYKPVGELGISSATNLYFDDISLGSDKVTKQALYLDAGEPISNSVKSDGSYEFQIPTDSADVYVPGYSVADRRGTGAGWNLTLQLGEFKQTNALTGETAHILRGATLSFPSVTPITVESANPSDNEIPTTTARTFEAGGDSAVLMNATKGQGKGLWEARYNSRELAYSNSSISTKAPIELTVPGDNYKGTYQANLTWSLADSPVSEVPAS